MPLFTRQFDFALLHQNQANLCLVQTKPPASEVIIADGNRPLSVQTLSNLLAPSNGHPPRLIQAVGSVRPVLVLLPEYALGSPDWQAVDALVRDYPGPILLVAGFGATPGAWLTQWAAGQHFPSPTTRFLVEEPVAGQPYNGGWCWVKSQAGALPECVGFFKGFENQGAEAVQIGVGLGLTTLSLEFTDLVIFPAICADLICNLPDGPRARILNHLGEVNPNKRRLVVGLLLQSTTMGMPFPAWTGAITALAAAPNMVVLANHSNDASFADEDRDAWRSISGAYTFGGAGLDNSIELLGTRGLSLGAIAGMVVRRSEACVTIGQIRWPPYGATTGRHLWPARRVCILGDDGTLAQTDVAGDAYDYEVARLVARLGLPDECDTRLEIGLERLVAHLETADEPRGKGVVRQSLNGLLSEAERAVPKADKLEVAHQSMKRALYAVGYLRASADSDWQGRPSELGQLKWTDGKANILVWHESELPPHSLRLKLEAWVEEGGAHPPLQVIVGTMDGDVETGEIKPALRTDFTQSSEPGNRDITEARGLRRAWFTNLGQVSVAYGTPSNDSEVLDNLVGTLKNQIAA